MRIVKWLIAAVWMAVLVMITLVAIETKYQVMDWKEWMEARQDRVERAVAPSINITGNPTIYNGGGEVIILEEKNVARR